MTSINPTIAINLSQASSATHPLISTTTTMADHSQRLQTIDARPRRKRPSDEREHRRPGRAKARHPADGPGDELLREDATGMVHDNGVDGTEEEADEGDGDGAADQRRHEPDNELEREAEEHVKEDNAPFAELQVRARRVKSVTDIWGWDEKGVNEPPF